MKKILSLLAIGAIVLGMASCGDGDPFEGKPFHIFVSNETAFGATIRILPTDKEGHYYWLLIEAEDVDAYSSVTDFCQHHKFNPNEFKEYTETGDVEYVVPSVQSGYPSKRKSNTEYVVIVFPLDEEYNPDFTQVVSWRFSTLPPEGGLKGWFTVDDKGKKVFFSKGNLYYDKTDGEYYFQDRQWDYVGKNADYTSGTGKIDLFGWGTGNAPERTTTVYADYSTFSEWGNHKIANGGNTTFQWRTLHNSEWQHLVLKRDRANELVGLGQVEGVNGMILLPDNWQPTAGLPAFKPVKDTEMKWNNNKYIDENKADHYVENKYTENQWQALEDKGAVFLPAVGWRYGIDVTDPDTYGNYWSCGAQSSYYAYDLYFEKYRFAPDGYSDCYSGRSVRLVWAGD